MKRVILFLSIFLVILRASNANDKDKVTINMNDINITYINFQPKTIDEVCLTKKIDRLFKIIELSRRASPHQIPSSCNFFPDKTIIITEKETAELSNLLLMKKHRSYRGNFEWNDVVKSKHLLLESKKEHIYVMYPLEPMFIIISYKPFTAIKDKESIAVRGLKEWIDMKACFGMDIKSSDGGR